MTGTPRGTLQGAFRRLRPSTQGTPGRRDAEMRLGRHMHSTVTAVWRYLRSEYEAMQEAEQRFRGCPVPEGEAPAEEERISEEDQSQGLARGRWRADRDLKLEYMFRVMMHHGSGWKRWVVMAANLESFSRDDLQDLPAKTVYLRWVRWVEAIAALLGVELGP